MARPIQDTPVLTGQDAKSFTDRMNNSKGQKISEEKLATIKANYERIVAISK